MHEHSDSPHLRNIWPLADQGIVSAGSFLTQFVLARVCGSSTYGSFVLLWGMIMVFVNLHAALVTYPLTLAVAQNPSDPSRHPIRTALAGTVALSVPCALLLPLACWYLRAMPSLPFVLAATGGWQFQEVLRRVLLARGRYRGVIPGDLISYPLQAFSLFAASRYGRLSFSGIFLTMALTSLAAAALQFVQARAWRSEAVSRPSLRRFWALGKWGGASTALGILQGPAAGWTLAAMWGTQATAGLQAITNILGVTHPLLFSLGNIAVPDAAAANARSGPAGAVAAARTWGRRFALPMVPYLVFVAAAPAVVLRLFYGAKSPYLVFSSAVTWMAFNYFALYAAQVNGAALSGLGRPDELYRATLKSTAATLLLVFPLIHYGGVWGAAAVLTIVNTMRYAWNARSLRRIEHEERL